MDTQARELERRLEQFSIDEARSHTPFTARLARENAWTAAYAARVLREYKRFALLAVTAGHSVTPSDAVDQAWHLHLTYTESYWGPFCREVLRQPLHHRPTRGGAAERRRFYGDYARTLDSYQRTFGTPPPPDIWPDNERRFSAEQRFARVNVSQHWMLPKPSRWLRELPRLAWRPQLFTGAALLLGLVLTGCAAIGSISPFNLAGPSFLVFYVCLWAITVFGAWLLRQSHSSEKMSESELDPYGAAYLTDGPKGTVAVAVASLVARGSLLFVRTTSTLTPSSPGLSSANLNPVERAVYDRVSELSSMRADALSNEAEALTAPLREWLERQGFLLRRDLRPFLLATVAPLIGMIKIGVGISRDRPVGFLIVLCLAAEALAFFAFRPRLAPSALGKAELQRLRARHATLRHGEVTELASAGTLPLALGLFGFAALGPNDLDGLVPFYRKIKEPSDTTGTDTGPPFSGATGGDSGGGDSAGSGDSGGGCGGGGCGGCGGGD